MSGVTAEIGHLRIGELSRRSGVSPELLRAWERRYRLLHPARSDGGYRLYSEQDERRVALMRAHLERGVSAAQAARLALQGAAPEPAAPGTDRPAAGLTGGDAGALDTPLVDGAAGELRAALDALDESAAHAALDRMLASLSLTAVLGEVVLPFLRELGERWERGEVSVGHEHFASSVLRGRLLGLARGWDGGGGPRTLLACPPGELHDLGLIAFGLALRGHGWRVTYVGTDTPLDTLGDMARELRPAAVVLAATTHRAFDGDRDALRDLAAQAPLWLAGAGATAQLADAAGAQLLDLEPLEAAGRVAAATRR
jgi:MerR family transcriptional regulator, light-induced transcriptional regulator